MNTTITTATTATAGTILAFDLGKYKSVACTYRSAEDHRRPVASRAERYAPFAE